MERRGMEKVRIAVVSLAIVLVAASMCRADVTSRRTPVVEAIESASPAVVNISTEQVVRQRYDPFGGFNDEFFQDFDDFFKDFQGTFPMQEYNRQTLGSGVIIDKVGYVLTNEHVIMQASKITVTLPDHREFEGELVGSDPNIDLAIVKINVDGNLPVAKMGSSDSLMIGETVIAIGNPFGLEHTVTTGVLSAKNRSIKGSDGRVYNDFIQTDASINPGNSGGPLIDLDGEVIGINTAIYAQAQGIGFAIPIDRAKRAITDLLAYGKVKQAWVGARVQELTPQLAKRFSFEGSYGALISETIEGSPADKAGLKSGDIVLEINSIPVRSTEDFYDKMSGLMVGEYARLKVFSDGAEKEIIVIAATLPLDSALDISKHWLGLDVEEVNDDNAGAYRLATSEGVVVVKVDPNGTAYKTGIREGDVIRQLGAVKVKTIDDYKEALVAASERYSAVILIQRGRNLYYTNIGTNE
jgi:serine protease Do